MVGLSVDRLGNRLTSGSPAWLSDGFVKLVGQWVDGASFSLFYII